MTKIDIETVILSDEEPGQSDAASSGIAWTAGVKATVFYDISDETYGYCLSGIGWDGNYFETDDVTGFSTPSEALEEARAQYNENMEAA